MPLAAALELLALEEAALEEAAVVFALAAAALPFLAGAAWRMEVGEGRLMEATEGI